MTIVSLRWSNG